MATTASDPDGGGMQPDDRVLLIDMENTVGSVRPRPAVVRARVRALQAAAGRVHHVVACYSAANPAADVVVSVLAELGVAPWPVPPGTDAAETALLQHARYVADRGGRIFVVASGDHRFAALANRGRLELLAWDGQKIAKKLEQAAADLRRIPIPKLDLDAEPNTTTLEEPAIPEPVNPSSHPEPTNNDRSDPEPAPTTAHHHPNRELATKLATAIAIGAGIAIGQRLMDTLLPGQRR